MDSKDKTYLEIETVRKTVTIDVDHQVHVESSSYAGNREWQRGAAADLTGVTMFFGPSKVIMSTQEAIDLATALTEAALFYREKKADALAHYEAMARDAKAGVASVDVVALLGALDGNTSSLKLNSQVFRAKKEVAELIAAAVPFARRNSSEPTVPVTLSTEDVTRLRAALAKVEGVV